jgi:hypothetical protein
MKWTIGLAIALAAAMAAAPSAAQQQVTVVAAEDYIPHAQLVPMCQQLCAQRNLRYVSASHQRGYKGDPTAIISYCTCVR